MNTEKTYKVSYKVYQNDRLKPVPFHGKEVHPLYIQVTFDRQPIYFKSYYFGLLSQPQYALQHYTGNKYPALEEVEQKEARLIDFIIERYTDHFSLELFKEKYAYYSRDLLNMMEEGFKQYLSTFFNDEGHNLLASMISQAGKYESGYQITEGLKGPLKPGLYEKMVTHAAYYAPPYLPLMEWARKKGESLLTTFSVFEWEQPEVQAGLDELMLQSYPEYDWKRVKSHIEHLVKKTA